VPAAPEADDREYLPYRWPLSAVSNMLHMFAYYMFKVLQLSATRVKHQITALKYNFMYRRCDVSVFNWAEPTAIRNGLTRQTPREEQTFRRRLPFTLDMVT
jgi:hypothetical protein